MKIIGFSGSAGSGKDTAAKFIVEKHNFTKVALADPMKRFCKEIYKFSDAQLWGESEMRNKPDKRFPKSGRQANYARLLNSVMEQPDKAALDVDCKQLACDGWLSPRELLQKIAGSWGRSYEDTWIDYSIDITKKLLNPTKIFAWKYDQASGLIKVLRDSFHRDTSGVIISDCRYINEINRIKDEGGKVIRILGGKGLKGDYAKHLSESEQKQIPDDIFDIIINNNGSIEDLKNKIEEAYSKIYK